jgi:hypothetical protein
MITEARWLSLVSPIDLLANTPPLTLRKYALLSIAVCRGRKKLAGREEVLQAAERYADTCDATHRRDGLRMCVAGEADRELRLCFGSDDSSIQVLLSHRSAAEAELVREVAGNPYKQPVWQVQRSVVYMASRIYREGAFADMPVLADAAEDAGCCDVDLLEHLRANRLHVKGCWALDKLAEFS